jgi:hypothetical protein
LGEEGRGVADLIAWAEASIVNVDALNRGADTIFGEIAQVTAWTDRD